MSCFNASDGLVTDVSSVLSDYLAGNKPLAVCDPSGLTLAEFRERFPASAAGTLLPPDLTGLGSFLAAVQNPSTDEHAAARSAVREHVLGAEPLSATERFAAAVEALANVPETLPVTPVTPRNPSLHSDR